MSKRKPDYAQVESKKRSDHDANESSDEEDFDMLDVEFEWFDPLPDIDFQGIKALLSQLLALDAHLFDISALTDLILGQNLLGSTVKVDGKETDPYAFLSVINLKEHREKPYVTKLINYLQGKSRSNSSLARLAQLLEDSNATIGLILSERLINVPAEVIPPMYTMLVEEMQWALEENEPYQFTHYLVLSKTYTEVASMLDEEDDRPKKKKKSSGSAVETLYFHAEDEVLQRHALCHGGYNYTTPADEGSSDSKRLFSELGIRPQSHAILIEATKFEDAVKEVSTYLSGGTSG